MKDFVRSRKTAVLFACLVTAIGWAAWNEVSAQPARTEFESITIDAREVRTALNNEEKRHSAAIAALEKARVGLAAANTDTTVIDRLIETEIADHRRREARLKDWLNSETAQRDDDMSRTRSIINRELRDFGNAIGSLNQSISIRPISSPSAQTGGTRFVDYVDYVDAPATQRRSTTAPGDAAERQTPLDPLEESAPAVAERVPGVKQRLGESLFGEVPRDRQADHVEYPTAIDQMQAQVEWLSRQLEVLRQQLAELKAARGTQ